MLNKDKCVGCDQLMKREHKEALIFIFITLIILIMLFFNIDLNMHSIERKTIKVGYITDIKPYCYINDNGTLMGFNVDVMNAVALELGLDIEWKEIKNEDILNDLKIGYVDYILGIDYQPHLFDFLVFSKSFDENKIAIFLKKYNTEIKSFDDLKYKKISVSKEDIFIKKIENIAGLRIFYDDNIENAVLLMIHGISDAYVGDKHIGMNYISNSKYKDEIKIIGDIDYSWVSSIATLKSKSELLETINKGLYKVEKKDTLNTIRKKWFGENISTYSKFMKRLMIIILFAAAIALLIVGIFYRINKILRKQVEERTLKINEEKIFKEEIINSLFEGLITMDMKGKIISINPSGEKITNDANIINKNIYDSHIRDIFDLSKIDYVIKNKSKLIRLENKVHIGNEERFIEYNISPVLINDNELSAITLTFRDITEEKNMMRKIIVKDKMESIGRLTAGIAHEIRNPITSIDMYVKLLPDKIDNVDFRTQILEDIPKEIKRLDNILINLLDYAKPMPSHKEEFYVASEIDFVLRLLMDQMRKNNIIVEINIDEDIIVYFDKQQFKQIIINILLNSIDALKDIDNPKILIKCYKNENVVRLEISDNGKGISNDISDTIFEPFFSTKDDGYGLGLSIVAQLVRENQSLVLLDTSYKDGAKFILTMN